VTLDKKATRQDRALALDYVAALVCCIGSTAILGLVLLRCRHGLELTDEGFYLHWISSPHAYKASNTQFGFMYHPLYRMTGGDVALMRMSSYLATFALAWALCGIALRTVWVGVERLHPIPWLGISAGVASTSLLVTAFELPQTPSYNTLAYQALLLGAIGLLLANTTKSRGSLIGYLLIGLSWWLCFMAKPPTAVAFALAGVAYLLVARRLSVPLLAVSVVTSAMWFWASALAIDGSAQAFVERLIEGVRQGKALESGSSISSIVRWDSPNLERSETVALLMGSILMLIAIQLAESPSRSRRVFGTSMGLAFSLASIAVCVGLYYPEISPRRYLGLQMLAVTIAGILAAFIGSRARCLTLSSGALAALFLALPYLYALGTGRPYWLNAEGAALFWVLSGVVVLGAWAAIRNAWHLLPPLVAKNQLITAVLVSVSMEHPYRQTLPLRHATDAVRIGPEGSTLLLSKDLAEYVRGLRRLADKGGFETNTPMIDLTGYSPGAVYALGGNALGAPWLIGGYHGSARSATTVLDAVSCDELAVAWILTEPGGPNEIPLDILKRYGIDPEADLEEIGATHSPGGASATRYAQHLLKPAHPAEARRACERQRSQTRAAGK
jgi:hypothetical protein